MRISVFGGSLTQPEEPQYEQALQLGKILGEAKHTVLTGGYIGTMEAVSQGCLTGNQHAALAEDAQVVEGLDTDVAPSFLPGLQGGLEARRGTAEQFQIVDVSVDDAVDLTESKGVGEKGKIDTVKIDIRGKDRIGAK